MAQAVRVKVLCLHHFRDGIVAMSSAQKVVVVGNTNSN